MSHFKTTKKLQNTIEKIKKDNPEANISDELFSNIGKMEQAKNRVQLVLNQAIAKTNDFFKRKFFIKYKRF